MEEMFLNVGDSPRALKHSAWYSFTPQGSVPTPRVGHTATYIKQQQIVVFIGGAVPDGLCQGTWILNLSNSTCKKVKTEGDFEHRYEHCAFDVTSHAEPVEENVGGKIWVFGGANTEENKNDLWEFDVKNSKWNKLVQQGDVPSKRTLHWNARVVEGLVVFGGGSRGVEAVLDSHTYRLDVSKRAWSVMQTTSEPPAPRHGHLLVTDSQGRLYVHGGINNTTFFDDLHILEHGAWKKPSVSENRPSGRASHGGVIHCGFLYVFGGLTKDGAANTFWKMNTTSFIWEQIIVGCPMFPARLDFAMAVIHLPNKFPQKDTTDDFEDVNSVEEYLNRDTNSVWLNNESGGREQELLPFILMHGGMDDKGMIYEDMLVYKLDPQEHGTPS